MKCLERTDTIIGWIGFKFQFYRQIEAFRGKLYFSLILLLFHKGELRHMTDQIELQKIHHCLRIIKNIKKRIGDEDAVHYVEKAIDLTQQWLNYKTDVSQKLYALLDDEECSLTLYQESEKDESMIDVWNCIIDAVAYICRRIYEEQGVDYLPEPIELVDEDTYSRLIAGYEKCMKQ